MTTESKYSSVLHIVILGAIFQTHQQAVEGRRKERNHFSEESHVPIRRHDKHREL